MKNIVSEMIDVAKESVENLKTRISNVRYGKPNNNKNFIFFDLDGEQKTGILQGRNRDLILGFGADADKAIACRVLLDGDIVE